MKVFLSIVCMSLFLLYTGSTYQLAYIQGENAILANVKENCLASGLNETICSNYIKIIVNKEWLRIKIIEEPKSKPVKPLFNKFVPMHQWSEEL